MDYDGNGEQDSLKETLKKLKIRSDAPKFAELNCSETLVGLE
jgi:hypothetical protein